MRGLTVALFVVPLVTLSAAAPAPAKEGVEATLTTNIPLDARPGTEVTVAWSLAYSGDEGHRRLFGASGVFVRFLSASGGAAQPGFAAQDRGRYSARVVVPEGGVGDIEIGLRGWVSGATGTRRSDLLFPITNDPLPGSARVAAPGSDPVALERTESDSTTWIVMVVAALLVAISAGAVAIRRRLTSLGPTSRP